MYSKKKKIKNIRQKQITALLDVNENISVTSDERLLWNRNTTSRTAIALFVFCFPDTTAHLDSAV